MKQKILPTGKIKFVILLISILISTVYFSCRKEQQASNGIVNRGSTKSWVLGLESAHLESTIQATGLLLAITTLHEFVHYGRESNHLSSRFIGTSGNSYEAGWSFETSISNNSVGGITAGNAISWVDFYPYNW